jgi:hypothetical protein
MRKLIDRRSRIGETTAGALCLAWVGVGVLGGPAGPGGDAAAAPSYQPVVQETDTRTWMSNFSRESRVETIFDDAYSGPGRSAEREPAGDAGPGGEAPGAGVRYALTAPFEAPAGAAAGPAGVGSTAAGDGTADAGAGLSDETLALVDGQPAGGGNRFADTDAGDTPRPTARPRVDNGYISVADGGGGSAPAVARADAGLSPDLEALLRRFFPDLAGADGQAGAPGEAIAAPLPPAGWAGLALLAGLGVVRLRRMVTPG